MRLNAVHALFHLQASAGINIGSRAEPGFLHFQTHVFFPQCGRAFFHAPHMIFLNVGVIRAPKFRRSGRQRHPLGEDIRIRLRLVPIRGVSDLIAGFRPGDAGHDFTAETVVCPRFDTSVRSSFLRDFSHAGVLVSRFPGVVRSVAFNTAGAQIAIAGDGISLTDAGDGSAVFPPLDGGDEFPRAGRNDLLFFQSEYGVFSFPLRHVPCSVGSLPVAGGVGRAPGGLFGNGESARSRVPGNCEGFKGVARDGIKAGGTVFPAHLLGEIEGDAVTGLRDIFDVGEPVPQVPYLPDASIRSPHNIQLSVKFFSCVSRAVFSGVAGGVFQGRGRTCGIVNGIARV